MRAARWPRSWSDVRGKISELSEQREVAAEDLLKHIEVRAPQTGLSASALGAYRGRSARTGLKPSRAQSVPTAATALRIEAKVSPNDTPSNLVQSGQLPYCALLGLQSAHYPAAEWHHNCGSQPN